MPSYAQIGRRFVTRVVLFSALAVWGWVFVASFLLCMMTKRIDLFRWPFSTWLDAAPWWHSVGWQMKLNIAVAAFAPTLVVLAIGTGLIRRRARSVTVPRVRQWLFGNSKWSTEAEQRSNRIITTRGPL
jgi:hypothetical protein